MTEIATPVNPTAEPTETELAAAFGPALARRPGAGEPIALPPLDFLDVWELLDGLSLRREHVAHFLGRAAEMAREHPSEASRSTYASLRQTFDRVSELERRIRAAVFGR